RGELAQAEARALEAAAALPWGGADWFRARGQAIIAAAKRGSLEVVEEQVQQIEAVTSSEDPDVRSARIICLSWAASYLIFGARYAVADPLMATIGKLAEADAVLDPQALALLQQVRAVRASSAGDLGRCLTGLEAALQAFEQAG
ncbi:MAG: serine/threonine-protein kinase PknK, partial [Pseudomonadota bacterium]